MMAKVVRSSPDREYVTLHDEVNRLFDSVLRGTPWEPGREEARRWRPAVDIRETNEEFLVRVDLPGIEREDVQVSVHGDTLTVRGERREEAEQKDVGWHRVERSQGSFERSFDLGSSVAAEKVSAKYKDGVLEVRIPKAEANRPREIPVQVTGD